MLSCKEVTTLCSQEMERPLHWREKILLRLHVMMCSGCTNFRQHMKTLRQTMHMYASGQAVKSDPEPDVKD